MRRHLRDGRQRRGQARHGHHLRGLAPRRQEGGHRPRRRQPRLPAPQRPARTGSPRTTPSSQAQIKAGRITKEQAPTAQYRNVITRAVGIQESVQVDTLLVDLLPGDLFMLCSDGLHGYLADEEVAQLFAQRAGEQLPRMLVDLANCARRQGQRHRGRASAVEADADAETTERGARPTIAAPHPALPAPHLQGAARDPRHRPQPHLPSGREIVIEKASRATSCSSSSAAR